MSTFRNGGVLALAVLVVLAAALLAYGVTTEVPIGSVKGQVTMTENGLPLPHAAVIIRPKTNAGVIVLSYTPNNLEPHRRLQAKLKDLMNRQRNCHIHGGECHQGIFARNLYLAEQSPLAGVAHQNGTVRFGDDPSTSVLDRNCRTHDVENLYVIDGSFFPSSSALNPALTIMANALRVGDLLLAD